MAGSMLMPWMTAGVMPSTPVFNATIAPARMGDQVRHIGALLLIARAGALGPSGRAVLGFGLGFGGGVEQVEPEHRHEHADQRRGGLRQVGKDRRQPLEDGQRAGVGQRGPGAAALGEHGGEHADTGGG